MPVIYQAELTVEQGTTGKETFKIACLGQKYPFLGSNYCKTNPQKTSQRLCLSLFPPILSNTKSTNWNTSTESKWRNLHVLKLIHGTGHVLGIIFITNVQVIIILRHQVNIMQDKAVPLFILHGFPDTNIKQLCSVK